MRRRQPVGPGFRHALAGHARRGEGRPAGAGFPTCSCRTRKMRRTAVSRPDDRGRHRCRSQRLRLGRLRHRRGVRPGSVPNWSRRASRGAEASPGISPDGLIALVHRGGAGPRGPARFWRGFCRPAHISSDGPSLRGSCRTRESRMRALLEPASLAHREPRAYRAARPTLRVSPSWEKATPQTGVN